MQAQRIDLMTAGNIQAAPAQNAMPKSAGQALWRGFRGRCPACGEGRMFRAFLKVNDACPHCGEELIITAPTIFPPTW